MQRFLIIQMYHAHVMSTLSALVCSFQGNKQDATVVVPETLRLHYKIVMKLVRSTILG